MSWAQAGVDPKIMGTGPIPASRAALKKAGWSTGDLDLIEANEAFAAQACAVNKDLGWDTSKVNVNGGAIAIGHPIGASGTRVLVTLLYEMQKRNAKKGLATLCIGGGMGIAMCLGAISTRALNASSALALTKIMAGPRSGRYGRLKRQLAPAIGVFKLAPDPGHSVPARVPGKFLNKSGES